MANLNITVNSQFNPLSFERLIQPYQLYRADYREQEDALAELDQKASIWERMANAQTDERTYNQYKRYADDLRNQAGELATRGLTPQSRKRMLDMKSRYSSEILPIEEGYKKREAEIKRQQEAMDKTGGKAVFTRDARTTSLDKYVFDNISDYGQANLDDIMKEGLVGGQNISKRYFTTKQGQLFGNDYYDLVQTQGIPPGEALGVLLASGKYPELNSYIRQSLDKVGLQNYSFYDQGRISNALLQGVSAGLTYEEKHNPMANWREQKAVDFAYREQGAENDFKRKMREKALEAQQAAMDNRIIGELLPIGVTGEVGPYGKLLKDLVPDELGRATTAEIMKLEKNLGGRYGKMAQDYETVMNLAKKYGMKNPLDWTSRDYLPLNATDLEQEIYRKARRNALKYKKLGEAREVLNSIKETELVNMPGKTEYEQVMNYLKLKDNQEKQDNYKWTFKGQTSQINDILKGFADDINGYTKEQIESGLGITTADGERISFEEAQKVVEALNKGRGAATPTFHSKTGAIGSGDENKGIYITVNGKEYALKTASSNAFGQVLNTSGEYLKDYDVKKMNPYEADLTPLRASGRFTSENIAYALNQISAGKGLTYLGEGLKGGVIRDTSIGDIIKVIVLDNGAGGVISSSLYDEIDGKGLIRDKAFQSLANQVVNIYHQQAPNLKK